MSKPVLKPTKDGVYPRCVWCNGENWAMAVIDYSVGKAPCAAVGGCGRYIPKEYIKLNDPAPTTPIIEEAE